ncbi:MAG: hypothetical protein LBH07_06330 [Treponema sp.]|jgi:acetylornithine deacetylase/succinyl-diaminopimelate desuccinylase-like protein|nr:hypothetical protein [Treponema sp.]
MNLLGFLKNAVQSGLNTLSGRTTQYLVRPRKSAYPLADRLLADAFRLGQLPSPAEQEKERASFVAERLEALKLPYVVDESGNILAMLYSLNETNISREPLLIFTRLVSERWSSLESLGKLELQYAQGAGLADALGPAALLSLAEAHVEGRLAPERDLYLFFSALHFDDPVSDAFQVFTSDARYRPVAAIGVKGFMLGYITSHTIGSYRAIINITEEEGQKTKANAVVSALIDIARHFQKTAETLGGDLYFYLKRIEAQSAFSLTPVEGLLELELESADGETLEKALENIKALSETIAYKGVKHSFRVAAYTPPGDPVLSRKLAGIVQEVMQELKIKMIKETKPDPASFLSDLGIPALSVGIASGREGLAHDTVEITSVEKGRQLLERLIILAGQHTIDLGGGAKHG